MRPLPGFFLAALAGLLAAPADAQLLGPSFGAGIAMPIRSEADTQERGIHLGAAFKLPILPLQFEAAMDRMSGKTDADDDLTILSAGAAIPISLTPPLLPLGVYLIAGGGFYRVDADETATNMGVSGGAGVSVGLGLRVFAEGRGVLVFGDDKRTYVTAALGLRF
jgi:hypothetical protein